MKYSSPNDYAKCDVSTVHYSLVALLRVITYERLFL